MSMMALPSSIYVPCLYDLRQNNNFFPYISLLHSPASLSSILQQALELGLLPESFGGQETVDFRDNIIPQVYAGIGLDLLIINITASASYDFKNSIPGAAVSVRLAW